MPEEVKTQTESSANSTCACFEKKKKKEKKQQSSKLQQVEMKVKCSMQSDCSFVCKRAKSSMWENQKRARKSFLWSHVWSLIPAPLKLQEKKKDRLILCNFTFMFSFSCYILCWFVLVDILISMAEITFNCSVEKCFFFSLWKKKKKKERRRNPAAWQSQT